MTFDASIQHHFEPFWKGYRFKDNLKEAKFQQKYAPPVVNAARLWAAFIIVFHIGMPLSFLSSDVRIWFQLAYIPNLVVASVCLVLLSWVPPKHAIIIASVAAVLICAGSGFEAHVHTYEWMAEARSDRLALVYDAVGGNATVTHQLQAYLWEETAAHETDSKFIQYGVQLILMVGLGFSQSTLMCLILMPCSFAAFAFSSPHFSIWGAMIRATILAAASVFVLKLAVMVATGRRSEFLLLEFFEASRQADSILNHTLKNTMADAAGQVELFLEGGRCSTEEAQPLQLCVASLYRGMRACRHRQAYVQMASNTYALSLQPVRLAQFVGRLAAGRHMQVEVCPARPARAPASSSASIAAPALAPACPVSLDPTLCGLVLDNAISNAFRHGATPDPAVRLTVTQREIEGPRLRLSFVVSNRADPSKPVITPRFVTGVLDGTNRNWVQPHSAMSDGIGLKHAFAAADLHGMEVSLTQNGALVQFTAQVTVSVADGVEVREEPRRTIDLDVFPPDLHVCIIDDSAASRRMLEHHVLSRLTQNVHVFGEKADDVAQFVDKTVTLGDIAILDQNLEFGAKDNVTGTDIIAQLLHKKFKGLICVRSGNAADEDIALYRGSGAHCVFGKDVSVREMVEDLKVAYVQHTGPSLLAPHALSTAVSSVHTPGTGAGTGTWAEAGRGAGMAECQAQSDGAPDTGTERPRGSLPAVPSIIDIGDTGTESPCSSLPAVPSLVDIVDTADPPFHNAGPPTAASPVRTTAAWSAPSWPR